MSGKNLIIYIGQDLKSVSGTPTSPHKSTKFQVVNSRHFRFK